MHTITNLRFLASKILCLPQMEDDAPGGSDLEATAGAEAMRAASHRPMVGWDILQWVEQVEQ